MAVNTENRRRSVLGMVIMSLVIAPVPDTLIGAADRKHITGFYAGVNAPVATSVLHITSTGPVEPNHISDSGDNHLFVGATEAQNGAFVGGATNYTEINATGDIKPKGSAFLVIEKASGRGIKVDHTTPTFGFADILGDQFSKNTGATKPTLTAYNGVIEAWLFANGKEAFISYHIPHDYVPSTDIHLHIHWSQNAAGATGGDVDFRYTAIYAKGHNQATGSVFTTTPKTALFTSVTLAGAGLTQYQQHLTEVTISAATATDALFDRDDFEPDGVIELTLEMDANNMTGTPSDPFIHFADLHYQTTGLIGTKSRTPDFYA
jgi:hypothetical protein